MKNRFHILILLAWLTCAITSCGGHADRASLVAIDSLIMHHPDSACTLLANYPADSLANDHDRAYHALLTTIAHYKAYRPATSDSIINIAVAYYDDDAANADHRTRALLYKGCVMEEIGNIKEALHYYKEAQYACPKADHFHKGYIHFRIASLYQDNLKTHEALKHFKLALKEFPNNNIYTNSCYDNIGRLYISINTDSALIYATKCLHLSLANGDSSKISQDYLGCANVNFIKQNYSKAKILAQTAIKYESSNKDLGPYYIICQSCLKLNQIDSAKSIMSVAPAPTSQIDSLQLYSCLLDIAHATNDYIHSPEYASKTDSINKIIDKQLFDNSLILSENDLDLAHEKNVSHSTIVTLLKWGLLASIVGFFLFWVYRKKQNNKFKVAQGKIQEFNEHIHSSLREFAKIKEDYDQHLVRSKEDTAILSEKTQQIADTLEQSITCYSNVLGNLLKEYKTTSEIKSKKIKNLMTPDFFAQLQQIVNFRFNNLVTKLHNSELCLSEEEINIICLDLCKFPNPILWTYSNCDRYKSLLNKKKLIAKKVYNADSIQEIPNLFIHR